MDIENVIRELTVKEIIQPNVLEYKPLQGGTFSSLYLLRNSDNQRFVVKSNNPKMLETEAFFLDFYKGTFVASSFVC